METVSTSDSSPPRGGRAFPAPERRGRPLLRARSRRGPAGLPGGRRAAQPRRDQSRGARSGVPRGGQQGAGLWRRRKKARASRVRPAAGEEPSSRPTGQRLHLLGAARRTPPRTLGCSRAARAARAGAGPEDASRRQSRPPSGTERQAANGGGRCSALHPFKKSGNCGTGEICGKEASGLRIGSPRVRSRIARGDPPPLPSGEQAQRSDERSFRM